MLRYAQEKKQEYDEKKAEKKAAKEAEKETEKQEECNVIPGDVDVEEEDAPLPTEYAEMLGALPCLALLICVRTEVDGIRSAS